MMHWIKRLFAKVKPLTDEEILTMPIGFDASPVLCDSLIRGYIIDNIKFNEATIKGADGMHGMYLFPYHVSLWDHDAIECHANGGGSLIVRNGKYLTSKEHCELTKAFEKERKRRKKLLNTTIGSREHREW